LLPTDQKSTDGYSWAFEKIVTPNAVRPLYSKSMPQQSESKSRSSSAQRDELLDQAMRLLRPGAKKAGVSQEKYLLGVLTGKYPPPGGSAGQKSVKGNH